MVHMSRHAAKYQTIRFPSKEEQALSTESLKAALGVELKGTEAFVTERTFGEKLWVAIVMGNPELGFFTTIGFRDADGIRLIETFKLPANRQLAAHVYIKFELIELEKPADFICIDEAGAAKIPAFENKFVCVPCWSSRDDECVPHYRAIERAGRLELVIDPRYCMSASDIAHDMLEFQHRVDEGLPSKPKDVLADIIYTRAVEQKPQAAVDVVDAMLQEGTESDVSVIGAGWLENLLIARGGVVLSDIVQRAAENSRWREALCSTWLERAPRSVRDEVYEFCKQTAQ